MDVSRILDFLSQLKVNNNRDWFAAHKDTYLEINKEINEFADAMILNISQFDDIGHLSAKDCTYRIYRDIRFSADKSPFKTHIGVYVCRGGKNSELAGYYIHFEPGNCMVAGGVWCPSKDNLEYIRRFIFNDPQSYLSIINHKDFKNNFLMMDDQLKTAPKGYPKDFEHIDLIRYKSFSPYKVFTDEEFCSDGFEDLATRHLAYMKPYIQYMNNILE
ncbi:MAG: DUF2461 domain-containing protein [Bacteroidales bacterium]|nr:DUF2461 domain-containing protein [Bacteroidales bacterium]